MPRQAQIAVCGASQAGAELLGAAAEVGRAIARAGGRVVCGGQGGVMEAVARGAAEAGGEVIGILPGTDPGAANEFITHPVASGVGHARNLAVVASGDAVIVIGGAWGTASELALARVIGRDVVVLHPPGGVSAGASADEGVHEAADPAEAVELALGLASARGDRR